MQSGRPRPTARHTRPGPEIKSIEQIWSDRKSNKRNEWGRQQNPILDFINLRYRRQEFNFCKLDIGRLENLQRSRVLRIVQWVLVRSFQTAQSHLVPSEEGAAALRPAPRLPFLQLPWARSERARSQPRTPRQKPDWTKWPRSWDASTVSIVYREFSRRAGLDVGRTSS
jgi:hypothetical protein